MDTLEQYRQEQREEQDRLTASEMKFFFGDGTWHVKPIGEAPVRRQMHFEAYVIIVNGEITKDKATGNEDFEDVVGRAVAREKVQSASIDTLRLIALLDDPRG